MAGCFYSQRAIYITENCWSFLALKLVMKEIHAFGNDLHVLFINFKQVYDRVHRKYWHETVTIYQIHKKLINDCQHIKQKF